MNETPKCSVCNWTNTGLWNLGIPGEPEWVCQGCAKLKLESCSDLTAALRECVEALTQLGADKFRSELKSLQAGKMPNTDGIAKAHQALTHARKLIDGGAK